MTRFRSNAHPFAILALYVLLGWLVVALMYVPGGLVPEGPFLGASVPFLLLVYFVARGSRLAWRILVAFDGVGLWGTLQFAIGRLQGHESWHTIFDAWLLVAMQIVSLWLLFSPSVRASLRPPYSGLHPPFRFLPRRMLGWRIPPP